MMAKGSSTAAGRGGAMTAVGDAGGGGSVLTEGFLRITINGQPFELRGQVGAHIKVAWHQPFEQGVSLGTIPEMIGAVAGALGVADGDAFTRQLNGKLEALSGVPGLKPVADILKNDPVVVTDLAIDTQNGAYQFGFGVKLENVTYKSISMDAFGLLFTYTSKAE